MAALGAIGVAYLITKRSIPVSVATPTGEGEQHTAVHQGTSLDVADGRDIGLGFIRAVIPSWNRILDGRVATYLDEFLQLRGTVVDSDDNPLSRDVLVINRQGSCVAKLRSGVDGTFKMLVDNSGASVLLVTALPDEGDNRNAVCKWKLIPVTPT